MPRLFTALGLPDQVRHRLGLLRGQLAGARWLEPDDLHITLRFFGDVDGPTGDDLARGLDAVRWSPLTVRLDGLGCFGGDKPRAVYIAASTNAGLGALQHAHERVAHGAGLPAETRKFTPHATLARLRGTRAGAVAGFLADMGVVAFEPYQADEFYLLSSRPGSGGGPYVVEDVYPATDL